MDIIQAIDKKIGEVRTESLDVSIGELTGLHANNELVIQPDFQRLFRWSYQQRSRLVESLLLELPIPSIFVIEKETGVLELIDGLQRVSSLIQFINAEALNLEALVLEGCDLVPELNGQTFEDLPITLRLRLKRTAVRTVVIKRQSSQFLRYEMFKRLNTGGAELSDQDVRNVNARMIGARGVEFYDFISHCATTPDYLATIDLLPNSAFEVRTDQELVLRFLAAKNYRHRYRGNVRDWLDGYMDEILLSDVQFDYNEEKKVFLKVFGCLNRKFGPHAFVKYRNGAPMGGVAPAYYEAVTIGAIGNLEKLESIDSAKAKSILAATVESDQFREVTGPGANSLPKLERRIAIVSEALAGA